MKWFLVLSLLLAGCVSNGPGIFPKSDEVKVTTSEVIAYNPKITATYILAEGDYYLVLTTDSGITVTKVRGE